MLKPVVKMDTFTEVKSTKKKKRRQRHDTSSLCSKRVEQIRFDLRETQFYKDTLGDLRKVLDDIQSPGCERSMEMVCYGLGNFADSYIARYQLALLIALREDVKKTTFVPCDVYDPQFTEEECNILRQLDLNVLQQNEEGKRSTRSDTITIFYMPHCGKALYNNVVWSNWGVQLKHVIIIGNSFTRMLESTPSRILEKTAQYVIKLQPYTSEQPFKIPIDYEDVFNDTSIHSFTSLDVGTTDMWDTSPEPVYTEDDAEIIFSS